MAGFNLAAAAAAIQKQRDAQPLRYAPGTLTLEARKAMEQKRQFNEELAENQRQFNIEAQMKAAAAARAASGGGGGGGSGVGSDSQWVTKLNSQADADKNALVKYQANLDKYKDKDVDPLHWTIREILTGETAEGTNSGKSIAIKNSAADPSKSVEALLNSLGTDTKSYFSGKNAGLGNIYDQVKGKQNEQNFMNQFLTEYGGGILNGE